MSETTVKGNSKSEAEKIFVLAVKEGNFVNTYNIIAEDLQEAIGKGKKYCESSNLKRRFIHVRPFLLDMERKLHDEKNPA